MTRYRGACAARLGLVDTARPALEQALVTAPPGLSKLRGRILADLALTHVHADEIDEACRLTGEAFDIAAGMSYTRLLGRVQEVRRAFPAPSAHPAPRAGSVWAWCISISPRFRR